MIDFGRILSILARVLLLALITTSLGGLIYALTAFAYPFIDAFFAVFSILGYTPAVLAVFVSSLSFFVVSKIFVFVRGFVS